jgi:hypothetical protein
MTGKIAEILPIVFAPLGLATADSLLFVAYRRSKVLAPEEIGVLPIYGEQAGGRFDGFNWTIPFVRVTAYSDFSVVSYWNHQLVLRRGQVEGIEEKRSLFSQGLTVHHTRADIPKEILIWPRNTVKLKQALEMSLF